MTKGTYKKRITNACIEAGTYKEQFDGVIETLASILENRDRAQVQYKASGYQPVIMRTNNAGATNMTKNPALVVITELNAQALQYWRELGLTVKAYQTLNADGFKKKKATFDDVLAKVGA